MKTDAVSRALLQELVYQPSVSSFRHIKVFADFLREKVNDLAVAWNR
jgi:hypothetical protein